MEKCCGSCKYFNCINEEKGLGECTYHKLNFKILNTFGSECQEFKPCINLGVSIQEMASQISDGIKRVKFTDNDAVNHPSHYNMGKYEAIEVIEDWQLGFCLGNTVKYISRAGHKDKSKTLEDLKKAMWYLEREISNLSKESIW